MNGRASRAAQGCHRQMVGQFCVQMRANPPNPLPWLAWPLPSKQSVMKDCKGLQKPEDLLQFSESTALTFTSNPACGGLQRKASESRNSVPDSKTVAMTGLGDAFVKRGSSVQVRSSAYQQKPSYSRIDSLYQN